jgi:hypothetical protein
LYSCTDLILIAADNIEEQSIGPIIYQSNLDTKFIICTASSRGMEPYNIERQDDTTLDVVITSVEGELRDMRLDRSDAESTIMFSCL